MSKLVATMKECKLTVTILLTVAFNLVFQISVATVIYTEFEQRYYFYSFLLLSLMAWVLYFTWVSIVKENPYELPSFLVLSSILNFHGIYMLAAHDQYMALSGVTFACLPLCQLAYCLLAYFAFRKFEFTALREARKEPLRIQRAYKFHESFTSLLKLDLCMGTYIYACFFYYVVVNWTPVAAGVCTTASLGMVAFVIWFVWGTMASDREHTSAFIIFMLFMPVIVGIKLYFGIGVILSPGTAVDTFVLVQLCIFGTFYAGLLDILIETGIVVLGILMERTFGLGVKDLRRRMDRTGLWKTLL